VTKGNEGQCEAAHATFIKLLTVNDKASNIEMKLEKCDDCHLDRNESTIISFFLDEEQPTSNCSLVLCIPLVYIMQSVLSVVSQINSRVSVWIHCGSP
jgi:hypothetical protein